MIDKLRLVSKCLFAAIFLITFNANAQTEIKINVPFVPLGMVNIAAEKALTKNISLQAEAFVSTWKSFAGKNLQFYMGTVEGRYYFREVMQGWYVGAYGSIAAFNLQKWNYFTPQPVIDSEGNAELLADGSVRLTERYQKGLAFIFGVSGGYHFTINDKLGLDLYAGIGSTQSLYKGYAKDNNERYDGAENWNRSGELIPTRGGLMLTYKLK